MPKSRKTKYNKMSRLRKTQVILSERAKKFKEIYYTQKGKRLFKSAKTIAEKHKIWKKYVKNRYVLNKNAKPIMIIIHK